jgi:hypothetical protein
MSNIFKFIAIALLITGCQNGYNKVDKKNMTRSPDGAISNHSSSITRDAAGAAEASTRAAKQILGQ